MKSVINKNLIWWRDVPVDVEWGLLTYLEKNWQGKITIVCANGYDDERSLCLWKEEDNKKIEFIVGNLDNDINKEKIKRLIDKESIHLVSGIKGGHHPYLDIMKKKKINSCILVMESPSLYGKNIIKLAKKILYPLQYGYYSLKYGKMFKALLVMGHDAKKIYTNYGWKKNKIFEFIYLPKEYKVSTVNLENNKSSVVKGLYIGRFDFEAKGVHILMKAINLIRPKNNWQIDFVGGYGKNKDEVQKWCLNTKNVNYLGTWDYNSVVQNMTTYDFCIVPSVYDGWNMGAIQSIYASIGCIISDNAGSDSLIKNSKSGEIFKAGDSLNLKNILEKIIDDDDLRNKWKTNAEKFQKNISVNIVGKYFIDVILYVFEEERNKPICPWKKID